MSHPTASAFTVNLWQEVFLVSLLAIVGATFTKIKEIPR